MIAKIVKGASFRGCVQYVTGKNEAKILASDGVLVINYEDSIRRRHQMEMAAQQREQEGQRLMRESDSIKKALHR